MITETLKNKIATSIERIKLASEMSEKYFGWPIYICISGGKDSSVISQLAIESGVNCIFTHSHTTVDAPTTVYFVRDEMQRFRDMGYQTQILYPKKTMFQLIEEKDGLPPTRLMRYCCKYFKERNVREDKKAFIVTGVRWEEGTKRKKREEFEVIAYKQENALRIKMEDQDLERRMFEECKLKGEKVCNAIIDWTEQDVWDFIRDRKIPYNKLYDLGFTRVGCIGCPMCNKKEKEHHFEMWPKYKDAYIRAIDKGLERAKQKGKKFTWAGGRTFRNVAQPVNRRRKQLWNVSNGGWKASEICLVNVDVRRRQKRPPAETAPLAPLSP